MPELATRRKPKSDGEVKIEFCIFGNPDNEKGNPLPKAKLTKRQQWTVKAQKYVAWKKHVADAFIKVLAGEVKRVCYARAGLGGKPIPPFTGRAHMSIRAHYANGQHPDTENVFGSIADSIFEDDNGLTGDFDFEISKPLAGITSVIITIPDIF